MCSYLSTELALGSVCSPFARNPFMVPIALSPLNSVPNPDSDEPCFIFDLGWPAGSLVNDGISKDFFFGSPCVVNLSHSQRIVSFLQESGRHQLAYHPRTKEHPLYPSSHQLDQQLKNIKTQLNRTEQQKVNKSQRQLKIDGSQIIRKMKPKISRKEIVKQKQPKIKRT